MNLLNCILVDEFPDLYGISELIEITESVKERLGPFGYNADQIRIAVSLRKYKEISNICKGDETVINGELAGKIPNKIVIKGVEWIPGFIEEGSIFAFHAPTMEKMSINSAEDLSRYVCIQGSMSRFRSGWVGEGQAEVYQHNKCSDCCCGLE